MRHHRKRAENRLVDTALPKRPGKYADGKGLWFIVDGGSRSWLFRYKMGGRERYMGLGAYPAVSVAEARQRAEQARRDKAAGLDPIEARDSREADRKAQDALAAAKLVTFKDCAQRYIAAHNPSWRNPKHAAQWPSSLEAYVYPIIGNLPVGEIDTALVLKVLEAKGEKGGTLWTEKPETMSRVRGRIQSILAWAKSRGYRKGENPASWENIKDLLPTRSRIKRIKHFAALKYGDVGAFMADLRKQEGLASLALQFAILNAARTVEVIGARWPEIDLVAKVWTIPPERSKNGKEQRKPLSDAALAILKAVKDIESAYVFPGRNPKVGLSNGAFLALLKRMKRTDITPHGFRSTFKDWATETTNFPYEASEMALGHTVGDEVERAYLRGDLLTKRRMLMQAWAGYCAKTDGGKVVAIDRAKRPAPRQAQHS